MKCECKECKFRGMELCEHRKLLDENAKMRGIYDREYLNKLKVSQHESELITANCELREENAKLREALTEAVKIYCSRYCLLDEYELCVDADCVAKKWREVLAKESGEEAK